MGGRQEKPKRRGLLRISAYCCSLLCSDFFFLEAPEKERGRFDCVVALSIVVEVAHALHDLNAVAGACVRLFYFYGIQDVTTLCGLFVCCDVSSLAENT
jgi:hypothetical protein